MLTEQAIVTHCEGRRVELQLQRNSACGNCELNQGCGTGALGRLLGHRSKPIVIESDRDLKPGDVLLLGLSEAALVRASLLVYGLPLLLMLIAGLFASLLTQQDFWIAAAALAGFAGGFKYASYRSRRLENAQLAPYIVDIQVNPGP